MRIVIGIILCSVLEIRCTLIPRLNYGLLFEETGLLDNSQQSWLHTIEIRLPNVSAIHTDHAVCLNYESAACEVLEPGLRQLAAMNDASESQATQVLSAIKDLLQETDLAGEGQTRRSLLPFVSDVLAGLFGTARSSDVERLTGFVRRLSGATRSLKDAFIADHDAMNSFVQNTDKKVNAVLRQVLINKARLQSLAASNDGTIKHFTHLMANLIRLTAEQLDYTINLRVRLEELFIGFQALLTGKLTASLVPMSIVQSSLDNVADELQKNFPLFHIVHKNVPYYYDQPVTFIRVQDSVFVTLNIPVSSSTSLFHVYNVISFPLTINNDSIQTTQVSNVPPGVAVDPINNYFIELSHSQLSLCHGPHRCVIHTPHRRLDNPTCIAALFFDQQKAIHEMCQFTLKAGQAAPLVVELGYNKVLLSNIQDIVFTCSQGKISKAKACPGTCIIDVPCFCSILADDYVIPSRMENCVPDNINPITVYPINLAVLPHLLNDFEIEANTLVNDTASYKIPSFDIFPNTTRLDDNDLTIDLTQAVKLANSG